MEPFVVAFYISKRVSIDFSLLVKLKKSFVDDEASPDFPSG